MLEMLDIVLFIDVSCYNSIPYYETGYQKNEIAT